MDTLIKDIRYGVRSLMKRPGFTAIAVITLALGIGSSTAIFSVVDGVLLRPLPYPDAEQIVQLREVSQIYCLASRPLISRPSSLFL